MGSDGAHRLYNKRARCVLVHASEAPEPELEKPAAQVQVAASALLVLLLGHAEQLLAMAAL
jgi:hypothetical protein